MDTNDSDDDTTCIHIDIGFRSTHKDHLSKLMFLTEHPDGRLFERKPNLELEKHIRLPEHRFVLSLRSGPLDYPTECDSYLAYLENEILSDSTLKRIAESDVFKKFSITTYDVWNLGPFGFHIKVDIAKTNYS